MKILITSSIFPPDIGGPATYVPKIANYLHSNGWDVCVYSLSNNLDIDLSKFPFKIILEKRDTKCNFVRKIKTFFTLYALSKNVDIIYANGVPLESTLVAKLLRKKIIKKFVGDVVWESEHGSGRTELTLHEFCERYTGVKSQLKKLIRNWLLKQSYKIITPSIYLRNFLVKYCNVPEGCIHVIYNGTAQLSKFNRNFCFESCLPIKLVTCSRLVKHKRISDIIKACSLFPNKFSLAIIGDGPERLPLESEASKSCVKVSFHGVLKHDEILRIYSQCDFFILNSTYEGLPHVVLEAMTCGLPVIATAVGGTPEVVRNGVNGYLVTEKINEDLSSVLAQVLDNKFNYETLSTNALNLEEHFYEKNMLEQTATFLADQIS